MLVNIQSQILHPIIKEKMKEAFKDDKMMQRFADEMSENSFIPSDIKGIMYCASLNPHLDTSPSINLDHFLSRVKLTNRIDKRNRKFNSVIHGRRSKLDELTYTEQQDLSVEQRWELDEQQTNIYSFTSYGVCDNPEQVYIRYKFLEKELEEYCIFLTPIFKEHQPSEGGWRWEKWGQYIGNKESKADYLYDEPDIDVVFVFSVNKINRNEPVYTSECGIKLIEDRFHFDVVDKNDVELGSIMEDKESGWWKVGYHKNPFFYSQSDEFEDILPLLKNCLGIT